MANCFQIYEVVCQIFHFAEREMFDKLRKNRSPENPCFPVKLLDDVNFSAFLMKKDVFDLNYFFPGIGIF